MSYQVQALQVAQNLYQNYSPAVFNAVSHARETLIKGVNVVSHGVNQLGLAHLLVDTVVITGGFAAISTISLRKAYLAGKAHPCDAIRWTLLSIVSAAASALNFYNTWGQQHSSSYAYNIQVINKESCKIVDNVQKCESFMCNAHGDCIPA